MDYARRQRFARCPVRDRLDSTPDSDFQTIGTSVLGARAYIIRLLLRNVIVRRGLDSVVVRNRVVVAFRAIRRLDRVRVRRYARMLFEGRSILPGYASVRDFEVRVSYCMSYRRRRNVVRSIR